MLDVVEIDAQQNPEIRERLPGLEEALDAGAMKRRFQSLLLEAGRGVIVDDCIRGKVHLGDDDCIVRYTLHLRGGLADATARVLVTCRVFGDETARRRSLEAALDLGVHVENNLGAQPSEIRVAEFESLSAVTYAFPIDPDLPSLVRATDSSEMRSLLGAAVMERVGSRGAIQRCDIEVAHYPRRYRCVLRFHIDPGPRHLVVYGKVAANDQALVEQMTADRLRQEFAQGPGISIKVPRYLAHIPELKLRVMEAVPGTPIIGQLIKEARPPVPGMKASPELDEAVDTCAAVLAAVHHADVGSDQTRDSNHEIKALRSDLDSIAALAPRFAAQIHELFEEVASRIEETEAMPLCFSHGDFTHSQVLFSGSDIALIDFDDVCQAEPALDLGQFCAYLLVAAAKVSRRNGFSDHIGVSLRNRFLNSYLSQAGISRPSVLRSRTMLYERLSLIRLALRSWRQIKPARVLTALSVLDAEETMNQRV
jgi:hypothetical protein